MKLPSGISREDLLLAVQHEWDKRAKARLHAFVRRGWQHAGLPGVFVDGRHVGCSAGGCRRSARRAAAGCCGAPRPGAPRASWSTCSGRRGRGCKQPDFSQAAGRRGSSSSTSRTGTTWRCGTASAAGSWSKSPWYQQLCEERVQILPYADQSAYFGLTSGGARRAYSIRAQITGRGQRRAGR